MTPIGGTTAATVTVVIPCYNYARYLPDAVDSALSQEGALVNVIVVDDKSTDNSLEVAEQLAASDERVTVIAHRTNKGPVETFNDGLSVADGEYVVRLDADDLLTPGSLKRAIAVMQRFPSVGLVYGHPVHFSGDRLPGHRGRATAWTIWSGRSWLAARCRHGYNVITSPEVLMRRTVVDHVGGQKPLAHTHDMEMWLRMAAFCDVAYIHGADQAWHRDHAHSLSAREMNAMRDLSERREAFETLFSGVAGNIPEAQAFQDLAKTAVAEQAIILAMEKFDRGSPEKAEIDALCEFVRSTVADAESVRGWSGLQRRIEIGPERTRRHPLFMVERFLRGLETRYAFWKWHRTGEF
ncbi:MAG: glycosyltransferase [Rhizobiaceae bacterium]|nr:glycosyltransferase [Rhizobiaceae bacterium]